MNRNENLRKALKTWIKIKDLNEIIIVDWSSDVSVSETIADIKDERIKLITVKGQKRWVLSWAYNLAASLVSYDKVLKIDADVLVDSDFIKTHPLSNDCFYSGNWRIAPDENQKHLNGQMFFLKKDFDQINGFNELVTTYGWDDCDLYERLESLGRERKDIDPKRLHHLEGTDAERTSKQNLEESELDLEIQKNRIFCTTIKWSLDNQKKQWASNGDIFQESNLPNDLAAITVYFNYSKNPYMRNAYKHFSNNLKRQNIKLYTMELAFEDQEFQLPEEEDIFRVRSDSLMWHKESLLNILANKIPKNFTKIAWLDCDIVIEDDGWTKKASELLEEKRVIQIGGNYKFLDSNGHVTHNITTATKAFVDGENDCYDLHKYHVGLAWAAKREFFENVGLFDLDVVGGNDAISYASFVSGDNPSKRFFENKRSLYHKYKCASIWEKAEEYAKHCFGFVQGKIGYVNCPVSHLYHGDIKSREYNTRYEYIENINLKKDIVRGQSNLLEWTDPILNEGIRYYFKSKDSPNKNLYDVKSVEGNNEIIHIAYDKKTGEAAYYYVTKDYIKKEKLKPIPRELKSDLSQIVEELSNDV